MKTSEGYSSMVILRARDPKTKELVTLPPFKLPPSHVHLAIQSSALGARHFAATYGLFRVCSMRNIHMMMPPTYREIWKGDFETLKQQDMKEGRSWMYEADPFAVLRERNEAKAKVEKKRTGQVKAKEIAADRVSGTVMASRNEIYRSKYESARSWHGAPKIEMGKKSRTRIEELVRKYAIWNPYNIKIPKSQEDSIKVELGNLGFRQSHIEEAILECKDREESLEWLLIHVPEDDLPQWALPEGYLAGVSIANSDLKRESAINRLAEAGYSLELCKQVYDKMADEGKAAEALQKLLLSNKDNATNLDSLTSEDLNLSSEVTWEEEISSLHAVFRERFTRAGEDIFQILLEPANYASGLKLIMQIRKPSNYPHEVPIISISATLPSYIRLSIIKQSLIYAQENLLGKQMLFFIIDWVEQNFNLILQRPGKLRELSSAAFAVSEAPTASEVQPIEHESQKIFENPKALGKTPNYPSREIWIHRQESPELQSKIQHRKTLPAWEKRQSIVDTISSYQVTIISGETGSGKSTQCVQFLLDNMYEKHLIDFTKIMFVTLIFK